MTNTRSVLRTRRRVVRAGIVSMTFLATTLVVSPSPAAVPCSGPPAVTPVTDLHPGTTGTAVTVILGTARVSFDVTVLGVLKDGIGPGVDLILVKASGPVIDQTTGIAFGMSGSPVYVNGRLAGAVAYGGGGDPTVVGLTPAQPMVDILSYPTSPAAARTIATLRAAHTIVLPAGFRLRAASEAGAGPGDFPTTVKQLDVPLAISGLSSLRLSQFTGRIARRALPFIPYASNSVTGPASTSGAALEPGDSFAAMISYGDVTTGAIGTTTLVCGDYAVAFGHPMFFDGRTALGMNAADVVTVVTDPSQTLGPYKVANVGNTLGTVDQDRAVGIRGIFGELPPLIRITSDVSNPDLGRSRIGETDVVKASQLSMIVPLHVQSNLDSVFDRIGDGSLRLNWTIAGNRQSGKPFTLNRANMWYSKTDAVGPASFLIGSEIDRLLNNGSEHITINHVNVTGTVTQQDLESTITRVLTASSLEPRLQQRAQLLVRPGDTVRVRVFLLPAGASRERVVDLRLKVPAGARGGGTLQVRGGRPSKPCLSCYGGFAAAGSSDGNGGGGFDQVLSQLQAQEASFDLIATLFPGNPAFSRRLVSAQPTIVHGNIEIPVRVVRSG